MEAAWAAAPTLDRVVQDILRFLQALQDVIDVDGAMVPNERRHGRRAALILPTPPGYESVLNDRREKYKNWYSQHADSNSDSDDDGEGE
eukprot:COSAG01_NODE_15298_length_1352_cov_115.447725_2_plen_89_part_00